MSTIRHLPPWLLPGYRRGTSTSSTTECRTWKDKYEASGDNQPNTAPPAIINVAGQPYLVNANPFEVVSVPSVVLVPSPRSASIVNNDELLTDGGGQSVLVPAAAVPLPVTEEHDCSAGECERVVINVSGQRFETQRRTLDRYPATLLGNAVKRRRYWDVHRHEFFIDRHRPTFQAVLYFYQSGGRLKRPFEVPEDVFLEELEFYGLGEATIEEYKRKEGYSIEKKMPLPKNACLRKIWLFCEEPDSSLAARIFAILSIIFIMTSITSFCMETLPAFHRPPCVNSTTDEHPSFHLVHDRDVFFIIESACVTWFSMEFLLRLASCPSKIDFARDVMNAIDVLAIVPFFIVLLIQIMEENCDPAKRSGSFVFIRVLRVFRVFKLSKHSQGLRILGLTIKTSLHELGMFFFFLLIAMVIFSSAAYYAEAGEENSQLKSIPGAFWWAIVTMTTVGYGDVTPVGVWGRLVGTLCVIAGVLTIALPVPVVVANFNNFYRHESGRGSGG